MCPILIVKTKQQDNTTTTGDRKGKHASAHVSRTTAETPHTYICTHIITPTNNNNNIEYIGPPAMGRIGIQQPLDQAPHRKQRGNPEAPHTRN
jgi:hypothetical protein